MKRLRELATLTVSEQRVIVAVLTALVVFVAARTYYRPSQDSRTTANGAIDQPSPSPGIGP